MLAAADTPPAACPNATVSTLDAPLSARFIVEYPCGWSVLEQPGQVPPAGSPRAGLVVDHLFFSPFPISLQPGSGTVAEITLDVWSDDVAVEGDLPTLEEWLTEARGRFTDMTEHAAKTRAGIPVVLIEGDIDGEGGPREAVLFVWEHTDEGVRRISEAFALEPSRSVRTTIGSLVASFRFPGG